MYLPDFKGTVTLLTFQFINWHGEGEIIFWNFRLLLLTPTFSNSGRSYYKKNYALSEIFKFIMINKLEKLIIIQLHTIEKFPDICSRWFGISNVFRYPIFDSCNRWYINNFFSFLKVCPNNQIILQFCWGFSVRDGDLDWRKSLWNLKSWSWWGRKSWKIIWREACYRNWIAWVITNHSVSI